MKKLTSFILAMLLTVTNVFASSDLPEFLTMLYTNHSADYSISMTFESSDDIASLLEELEIPEEISYYADIKSLLKTLFSYEGKMNLQADISDNYDKIKMALTSESVHNIDINPNLNIGVNAKEGLWLDIDLSDKEAPVFDIIYSYPFMNRYVKINAAKSLDSDATNTIKLIFNKKFIDELNEKAIELFAQHAHIKGSGNKYTVTMDNEGLTAYIDELIPVISNIVKLISGDEFSDIYGEIPSTSGWKILGENGIQTVYTLRGNHISAQKSTADISIDIPQIYEALTGEEWAYASSGKIDFTLETSSSISKIGSTKPEFPVLTEENSVTLDDLQPDYTYEEPEISYPLWYADGYCNQLPVIDGDIYIPLRLTLESAYEDSISIDYNDGVVTAESEYFSGFNKLTVIIGSEKTYADDTEYNFGKAILIDGTTYVSGKLFSDILNWELTDAEYNIITNEYYYAFITDQF